MGRGKGECPCPAPPAPRRGRGGRASPPCLFPLAPSPPVKPPAVVAAFEEALGRLGVHVRRERGPFRGGLCTVDGDEVVVLNRAQPPEAQAAVLAAAIRRCDHAGLYLRPAVRAALDDAWAAADAGHDAGGAETGAETDDGP